ncbi:hypothetical protein JOF46_003544 [Paeniglutamicibacter psychrophenolicus]|uniref:Uncharacterized protein n=1 Tax=Paeniglutamicibacter psychrophenolicus TaxID=257454 RepID=A0ABS4WHF7_9MICC|nr:hypothetical protein [Paeniglutamicibacter psychrophenolicus]
MRCFTRQGSTLQQGDPVKSMIGNVLHGVLI